ncbi:PEP-CTERM system TPR-repeat protein PrsT [Thalassotalea psychrophila]|uniref:PEP-CTERM system TPR-repeat protein PrsT n=1 Tax=Thalassotalea psychrophila TaxID=3065647 RepID=A0ABY9TUP6_9GAMM|nr:PEP-CTERM system TPR-repeat protein PrsT [Colwelliaceae bacterium SQ149]
MSPLTLKPIILTSLLCLFVSACSPSKTNEEYKASAKQLIAEADYKTAVIELKNALQQTPEDAESRFLLGKAYLRFGDVSGAKKELNRALEQSYDANQTLPLLVRAELVLGDVKSVMDHIATLENLHPDTVIQIKSVAGIGLTYLGAHEQGMPILAGLLSVNNNDGFYFQLAKAWVAANNDQLELAIELAHKLIAEDSEFNDAELLLANLYAIDQQFDLAINSLTEYIDKHSYNYLVRLNLASIYIQLERLVDAEKEIDLMLARFPSSAIINEFKAEIKIRQGAYKEATEYAGIAITAGPSLFKANLIAGIGFYQINNAEMAFHHLSAIESRLSPNHFGNQILSLVRLKLGYTDEAIAAINAIENVSEKDFNLLSSASMTLIRNGDTAQAAKFIHKMDDIDSNDSATISKRGIFKLSINDESGITDLEQAIKLDPEYDQARLALLYNYIKAGQYQQAMTVANTWINEFPNKENGYLAKGVVWRRQQNLEQAKLSFLQAMNKNPDSVGALFNLALINIKENNFTDAFEQISKSLQIEPTHIGAMGVLINLSNQLDDANKVPTFISELIKSDPENLTLKIARAKSLERVGNSEQALKELSDLKASADKDSAYLSSYSAMAFRAKKFQLAEGLYTQLIKLSPGQFKSHLGLLISLEAQKKYQQAFTEVKKAQQKFPDQEVLKLYEINYLVQSKSLNQAKQVIDVVDIQKVPEEFYLSVVTDYYFKAKDYGKAKDYARQWYQADTSLKSSVVYAQTLQANKDNDMAIKIVTSAIDEFGSNIVLENILAELTVETNPQQALAHYQSLADKNPDNFIVLNNLAWSAIMANDFELALASAKKAKQLAPELPQVIDTLAVVHMKLEQYQLAHDLLEEAVDLSPENEEILLHYAEVLIQLNKLSESSEVLGRVNDGPEKQMVQTLLQAKQG